MSARHDFQECTVLVTGAAGGIGQAIVEGFARAGARVIAVDLDPAALRQVVKVQLALGHEVEGLAVDLADEQAIATLLAGLERLDVLVHNAAYFPLTPSPTSPRHCCNARWRSTWARCSG